MRKLIPVKGSVVCKKIIGGKRTETMGGIKINVSDVDIYEIISFPEIKPEEIYPFKVGDMVISNSTGDEIEINPNETVYLFKLENIMCKVENEDYNT